MRYRLQRYRDTEIQINSLTLTSLGCAAWFADLDWGEGVRNTASADGEIEDQTLSSVSGPQML